MGATPVTWGMWKEYCKAERVRMPTKPEWGYLDNHPVVNVSWNDIVYPGGFCEWASSKSGYRLILPTSDQFEFGARGGKIGLNYPWGNKFDRSKLWCSNAVKEVTGDQLFDLLKKRIRDRNVSDKATLKQMRTFRSFSAGSINTGRSGAVDRTDRIYRNGYGLTDMSGNVWQICADRFAGSHSTVVTKPSNETVNGDRRFDSPFRRAWEGYQDLRRLTRELQNFKIERTCSIQGGSWANDTSDCFAIWHEESIYGLGANYVDVGFRLVAPPK